MANPRDSIQRLADALHNAIRVIKHEDGTQHIDTALVVLSEARAYLAATPEPEPVFTAEEVEMIAAPWSYLQPSLPTPIPLSERLPGTGDLTDEHFGVEWCWWGRRFAGGWEWHQGGTRYGAMPGTFSHWLPAHALPLPEAQP